MKKIPLLSNIFSRSRPPTGALETDALPVEDPPDNGSTLLHNTPSNNTSLNSGDLNAALQLQAQINESADLSMDRARANSQTEVVEYPGAAGPTSVTNNQMAVHNTQGQVVMQFSNINGLHFGSVYNISGELTQPASEASTSSGTSRVGRPRRTTTIEAMMRSSEELNHRMMDVISTHLGEGWKKVLRDLGLTDGQIEQAVIDHQIHGGIREVIYQLLLGWVRNAEDGEATLAVITQLLWKSGHRECVNKMKEAWKQDNFTRKT